MGVRFEGPRVTRDLRCNNVDKSIHSQSDGVDSATSCTAYTFLCSVDSKRYETEVSARDPILTMTLTSVWVNSFLSTLTLVECFSSVSKRTTNFHITYAFGRPLGR